MRKYFKEIQNTIKENIRSNSRISLLKSGHQDTYRRTYDNININKEFENMQIKYKLKSLEDSNLENSLLQNSIDNNNYYNQQENQNIIDLMSLEEIENYYIKKIEKEEHEESLSINQEVILNNMKKEIILADIILLEFCEKNFESDKLHPKIKQQIEHIHNCLIHNIPVKKRLLFECFPYFFKEEIGMLSEDKRLMFPMRQSYYTLYNKEYIIDSNKNNELISNNSNNINNNTYNNLYINSFKAPIGIQKENKMISEKSIDVVLINMELDIHLAEQRYFEKYKIFIDQAINEWNWSDKETYLKAVMIKDKEYLTYGEELLRAFMEEIEHMKEELYCLKQAYNLQKFDDQWQLTHNSFSFPVSDNLLKIINDKLSYARKYKTFNYKDTILNPISLNPKQSIMEYLRQNKQFDIDALIQKDKEEYKEFLKTGLSIPDFKTKGNPYDESHPSYKLYNSYLKKFQLINDALKEYIKAPDLNKLFYEIPNAGALPLDHIEENYLGHYPSKGRIHVEEYYKSLFLNERDNKRYDFNYFYNYFEIDPVTMRNIFNYVYFPVVKHYVDYDYNPEENEDKDFSINVFNPKEIDINSTSYKKSEITRIIYFKDPEYEERRKLIESMSPEDYKEYISNDLNLKKPELAELNRLEYLSHIKNSTSPRISKNTVLFDPEEEEYRLSGGYTVRMSDNLINTQIDNKIKLLAESNIDKLTINKDPDVVERIKNLNDKLKLYASNNYKYIDKLSHDEEMLVRYEYESIDYNDESSNKINKNLNNIELIENKDEDKDKDKNK